MNAADGKTKFVSYACITTWLPRLSLKKKGRWNDCLWFINSAAQSATENFKREIESKSFRGKRKKFSISFDGKEREKFNESSRSCFFFYVIVVAEILICIEKLERKWHRACCSIWSNLKQLCDILTMGVEDFRNFIINSSPSQNLKCISSCSSLSFHSPNKISLTTKYFLCSFITQSSAQLSLDAVTLSN